VAGALDGDEAGAGKGGPVGGAVVGGGDEAVLGAPHEQGRDVDPAQAAAQARVVEVRLPPIKGGGLAAPGDDIHLVLGQPRVVHGGRRGIGVLQPPHLVGIEGPDVGDVPGLAVADLDAEGIDQHQARQARRALHGHLGGDPPAQGGAHQHGVAGVALGEQIEVEVGQVVHGVDAVGLGRVAEPGMRGRDHPPVPSQQIEEGRVGIEAFLAVEPEDRPPVATLDDLEPDAVKRQPAGRRRCRHAAPTIANLHASLTRRGRGPDTRHP